MSARDLVSEHPLGFGLVAGASEPTLDTSISPEFWYELVTSLQALYDYVIIDTNWLSHIRLCEGLREVEDLLVLWIVDPRRPALQANLLGFSSFETLGILTSDWRLIYKDPGSLASGDLVLDPHEIEDKFQRRFDAVIHTQSPVANTAADLRPRTTESDKLEVSAKIALETVVRLVVPTAT